MAEAAFRKEGTKLGRFVCFVLLLIFSLATQAAQELNVGFHRLELTDPLDNRPMRAIAFYPTRAAARPTTIGIFTLPLAEEAPAVAGHHPLLLLSHGNGGTPLALRDLVLALAQRGFVVVTLVHPGDNLHDQSRLGALSNLYGRPLQVSEAINAALLDKRLAPMLDPQRIGVIGYSAGGETALILAGAQPRLDRLRHYCAERPDDLDACSSHGELQADRSDLTAMSDPRVGAVMLLAPLGLMFGSHELAKVDVPVLLYSGDNDQVLDWTRNAASLARLLPHIPDFHLLSGAGHFVFMAPCSDAETQATPGLCNDAAGVDRQAIHRDLITDATRFFNDQLKAPNLQAMLR
ncbi:alpha/beta hydrolase family protein [Pseudomonas panipatensis]|uniref:alpha/beta hydrolase family protein n=1 Tax=Pseudomonas panipatensis TaxID=428992 RepID=UPI0035B4EF78